MSKVTVLITRPDFDDATAYLSACAEEVIEEARNRGINVCELPRGKVTKSEFEKRLSKNNPQLVFFNGHGSNDCITGDSKEEIILKLNDNEHLLKDKFVHALACNAAKDLGPSCVRKGAKAFIGFKQEFVFLQDEKYTATPRKDKIAAHFIGAANVVPLSLLKGNSLQEAFDKSQKAFEKSIDYFETHYDVDNSHVLFWLRYDRRIQTILGNDPSLTIRDLQ